MSLSRCSVYRHRILLHSENQRGAEFGHTVISAPPVPPSGSGADSVNDIAIFESGAVSKSRSAVVEYAISIQGYMIIDHWQTDKAIINGTARCKRRGGLCAQSAPCRSLHHNKSRRPIYLN